MQKIPLIKTPRGYRLMHALLFSNGLPVSDLREAIGSLNVPDVVMKLRRSGWDIHCTRVDFYDRDGRNCRPGIYWLDDDAKQKALIALRVCKEEWEAATSQSKELETIKNQSSRA